MVRLGVPDDQPLCVQQWTGLVCHPRKKGGNLVLSRMLQIAINYPARKFGITRHMDVS